MKHTRILLILGIIAFALLNGCSKDDNLPDTSKYAIYTAGEYNINHACYWKNGERSDFGVVSDITGMSVSNGDVYVSGYFSAGNAPPYSAPSFWKNGVKTNLPDDTDLPSGSPFRAAYAKGVYATGNDVYTVGRYNVSDASPYNFRVQPCYWKNTTRFDITDYPDRFAETTCIFVSGSDVYIGGKYLVPNSDGFSEAYQACYWKNGVKTDLPAGVDSYVTDIFVENGKVYAVGSWKNETFPPFYSTVCYWADGQKVDLITVKDPLYDFHHANAIFVDNGTVYIAGGLSYEGSGNACYWKGNNLTKLTKNAAAHSIFVKDGIVFTSGCCDAKNGKCYETGAIGTVPCYWVNTKCTELSIESHDWCNSYNNYAIGIFVE